MRDNTDSQTDENEKKIDLAVIYTSWQSLLWEKEEGRGKGVEEKVLGEYNLSTLGPEQKFLYESLHSLQYIHNNKDV